MELIKKCFNYIEKWMTGNSRDMKCFSKHTNFVININLSEHKINYFPIFSYTLFKYFVYSFYNIS